MIGGDFWSRARQPLLSREHASRNQQNNAINCSFRHLLRLNTCPYSVSVFTIESVACNFAIICFSDSKVSRKIARKTVCGMFGQLISQEISQATSSLTFLTRNWILETLDSILETRDGSGDCQLNFERYCMLSRDSVLGL